MNTPRNVALELAERLSVHVDTLAGTIGERHLLRPDSYCAAAGYIRSVWRALGYQITEQAFPSSGSTAVNLEVTRRGTQLADEIILVGAHYDTERACPGADDNASGVAALLEISRLFTGVECARTVRFVAFANEEMPHFMQADMGSLRYAQAARARHENIRLMISLEMLGYYTDAPGSQQYPAMLKPLYPDRGDFIGFVSNFRSRTAMRHLVDAFRASSRFPSEHLSTFESVPGVSMSDHASFWRQGYPAVMVTDTAFYRNPYYHTPEDTPDKLDYPRFGMVTEGLFGALQTVAGDLEL